jgi:hypothetical protein
MQDSPHDLPGYATPFILNAKKIKKEVGNLGGL